MSDINLLPEDLKKKAEKILDDRGNLKVDEVELTHGERLRKPKDDSEVSIKDKIISWLKKLLRPKLEPSFSKKVLKSKLEKDLSKEKGLRIKLDKAEIKKTDEKKQKLKLKKSLFHRLPHKKLSSKDLIKKELIKDKQRIEKPSQINLVQTIEPEKKELTPIHDKEKYTTKIKMKKSKDIFSRLLSEFKNPFRKKVGKKERKFNVNLLPFGIGFHSKSRVSFVLISAFIVSCVIVFVVYFGLNIYEMSITSDYKSIENEFEVYMSSIEDYGDSIYEIEVWENKIQKIKDLFNHHVYWTKFFKAIDDNTLPGVQFFGFAGSINGNIVLSAIAPDYQTVAKQWLHLQNAEDFVEEVIIDGASMASSGDDIYVSFSLTLDFVDGIFYKNADFDNSD